MYKENMEEVFKQSPIELSYDEVEVIFLKNNKNVLETLAELWKVCDEKVYNIDETKNKWNEIRSVCDCFDNEMKKKK
jgi:hypothetical protein